MLARCRFNTPTRRPSAAYARSAVFTPFDSQPRRSTYEPVPPETPQPVQQRVSSDYWLKRQFILVFWNSPNDNGLPIERYELNVTNDDGQLEGSNDYALQSSSSCAASSCIISLTDTVFNAKVSYAALNRTFSVRAYNQAGWSGWSAPTVFSTDGPEAPLRMHEPRASEPRPPRPLQATLDCVPARPGRGAGITACAPH